MTSPAPTRTKPARRTTPAAARMSLAEAMQALQAAGSEQTRKTYARHGARIPMFGVSFATLKTLHKRIKVDHELALALWETGNYDARNLAFKVVDPSLMTRAQLDHWSQDPNTFMCSCYVAQVAVEGPHALACVESWLASADEHPRSVGWKLVGALATHDETLDDAWFEPHLAAIEHGIHAAPNGEREAMNHALIEIGCRNPTLRQAATAAAKRIGKVEIDYGDTACKTRDAVGMLDKAWDYAITRQAPSPAAQERARQPLRTRC